MRSHCLGPSNNLFFHLFLMIFLLFMNFKIKGIGGPSPGRVLKEATSMELHNSKLNNEVDGWKNKAKQYQVKIFCYHLSAIFFTFDIEFIQGWLWKIAFKFWAIWKRAENHSTEIRKYWETAENGPYNKRQS